VPELDGFRAIAVVWVVLHHALYAWPGSEAALERWPRLVTFVLDRGWLGVDLFFVLSGFLISGILLDTRLQRNYWRNFYARRALRILPIYLLVLTACWVAYDGYGSYFRLSLAMLANFAGYFKASIPHGPGVFWSLSVEEHFYFVWPCVVWLLSRRALFAVATAVVLLVPVLRGGAALAGMDPQNEIYVYSWFRVDGLALGATLAMWVRDPRWTERRSLGVAAGLFVSAVVVTAVGWPFGVMATKTVAATALRYTQVQLVFAAAILAAVTMRGTAWTAPLRTGLFRVTSEFSYCIYLVHLSLGDAYVATFERSTGAASTATLLVRVAAILVASYATAWLSFRLVEQPFLSFKRFFQDASPADAGTPQARLAVPHKPFHNSLADP